MKTNPHPNVQIHFLDDPPRYHLARRATKPLTVVLVVASMLLMAAATLALLVVVNL